MITARWRGTRGDAGGALIRDVASDGHQFLLFRLHHVVDVFDRLVGQLLDVVLAAALFGVSAPISKRLLGDVTPTVLAGLLYLGAIGCTPLLPGDDSLDGSVADDGDVSMDTGIGADGGDAGCGDACPVVPGMRRDDWPLPDPKGQPIETVTL